MTQKDIAEEAGVSMVTVSNVINGNYKKVSRETVDKINKIIEKYHFVPNAMARSLAKKESQIIGVIIPNVGEDDNLLRSPYYAEILGVLERTIRKKGYFLMTRCVGSCTEILPLLSSWNVDGVLFMGAFERDAEIITNEISLPCVFFDTYNNDKRINNVGTLDYKGGYIGTQYLINQGHKNIVFLGPEVHGETVIPKRYQGYEQAMKERGLEQNIGWQFAAFTTYECGVENGKKISYEHPGVTAVFAAADILALGVMRGLRLSGKRIPEDVSVMGFDNLEECMYSDPQLTTVSQNISLKAEMAAERLFAMIQDKASGEFNESVDVEIIERQSVRRI